MPNRCDSSRSWREGCPFRQVGYKISAMQTLEIRPQQQKTDLLSAIGETLRAIRTERGLTLRQVAEGAHVSISYLAEIERGEKDPSSRVLESVAGGLGIEVGDLLLRVATTLEPKTLSATPVAGKLAA
jgi:ribosome-binding protein aMBF1 (putative translation factor)